jgi:hypothetical protein
MSIARATTLSSGDSAIAGALLGVAVTEDGSGIGELAEGAGILAEGGNEGLQKTQSVCSEVILSCAIEASIGRNSDQIVAQITQKVNPLSPNIEAPD